MYVQFTSCVYGVFAFFINFTQDLIGLGPFNSPKVFIELVILKMFRRFPGKSQAVQWVFCCCCFFLAGGEGGGGFLKILRTVYCEIQT